MKPRAVRLMPNDVVEIKTPSGEVLCRVAWEPDSTDKTPTVDVSWPNTVALGCGVYSQRRIERLMRQFK